MATWKEFIEKAKAAGIKDDDEIAYMDFNGDDDFSFFIDDTPWRDGTPGRPRSVTVS
jgi:hypothetical protein